MTDFAGLLRALTSADVEFVLIGGVAATVHGSARLTRDVDVIYRRSAENHARLVRALAPHAPYLRGAPPGLPSRGPAHRSPRLAAAAKPVPGGTSTPSTEPGTSRSRTSAGPTQEPDGLPRRGADVEAQT